VQHYPKVAGLLSQVAVHDWKVIAVSQMNPLIPSSTLGYVFGLSRVAFKRYLVFTIVFMLPLQVLFVMTGHSVISLILSDAHRGVALALIAFTLMIALLGKRIYRKLCLLFGVSNDA
jgi:uncharacterized membrane protein YdjX (TVP38/TMEM64 family)